MKSGDIIRHRLDNKSLLILTKADDGMVDCRYVLGNGEYARICCYPHEIEPMPEVLSAKAGFDNGEKP